MSDRYYYRRYRSLSPEPYIIERRPRVISRSPTPSSRWSAPSARKVSFGGSTDPRSKKTVVFKESTYRRTRRSNRRSRTPSPVPSPSPPRGPNHIMSERIGDSYVPLPRELPKKGSERSSGSEREDESEEKRKERRRRQHKSDARPMVHHYDDEDYPVVESPSTPSSDRRDSGVYSGHVSPPSRGSKYNDSKGRLLMPAERRDDPVRELTQQFNKIITDKELDKLEAEAKANKLQEKLDKAQAEIEQNKRKSWLDERERKLFDREQGYRDNQRRLSQTSSRESLPKRDVVVCQPLQPPVMSGGYEDPAANALAKAKADWNKRTSGNSGGGKMR